MACRASARTVQTPTGLKDDPEIGQIEFPRISELTLLMISPSQRHVLLTRLERDVLRCDVPSHVTKGKVPERNRKREVRAMVLMRVFMLLRFVLVISNVDIVRKCSKV